MMTTVNEVQMQRDVWRERILSAYRAKRFSEVLDMMADNHQDRGDVYAMIENFCSESDPLRRDF